MSTASDRSSPSAPSGPEAQRPQYRLQTTGSATSVAAFVTRAGVSLLSRVAPGLAEEYACRRFLRPSRSRRPPGPAAGVDGSRADEGIPLLVWLGGKRIAAESRGTGPAVLLVHGWSGSRADMRSIADALVRAGFRAVSVDLPAHGASSGSHTTLPEMMGAIATVASLVGPLAGIVAHSLGAAAVTLALAEAQLEAAAVVLLAPTYGPIAFVERYRRWIGLPASRVQGMVARVSRRAGREVASLDARIGASRLTLPALVIQDPHDREVPFEQGVSIAKAWRGSVLVPVEGVGHRRILTDPEVLDSMERFLRM